MPGGAGLSARAGVEYAAGAFGAMLFSLVVGSLIEHHGFAPAFFIAGLLHPIALLVILASVKRILPLGSSA